MLSTSASSALGTDALAAGLQKMQSMTDEGYAACELLMQRSRQLDSLTSPAGDASSMLSRANANLQATLVLMRDAREKFDTLHDCEPAIELLSKAVKEMEQRRAAGRTKGTYNSKTTLTEQDVYAAGDSMEILRDAHAYFVDRRAWKAAPSTLGSLEGLHKKGLEAMCLLISYYLKSSGPAVRPKRRQRDANQTAPSEETAYQTRERFVLALQNRDLLRSISEFEAYQPVDARPIREVRSIFDCLGSHGYALGPRPKKEPEGLANLFGLQAQKVIRTEKVGTGCYCNLTKQPLKTGFPQLDAYGESRKSIAFASMESYWKKIKVEKKKRLEKNLEQSTTMDEADAAARDAIRCLEYAMVVVAGEKEIYRQIVTPQVQLMVDTGDEDDDDDEEHSPYLKKACAATYAYIVASVVDRVLDIIEFVFLKECGIGQMSSKTGQNGPIFTVTVASLSAAAGLRMLDGVRMLGPSLAKLCEMKVEDGVTNPSSSLAAILCIAIHRTTVKNCARTLENLAKAIQDDPLKGPFHRPKDASVSVVSRDVVAAIRLVAPFGSAYKSVSKRRALPWDPNMGEEAGELDTYLRYLVMRLLNSLKGKALKYIEEGRDDSQAKSSLFMINNSFYLLMELAPEENDATPAGATASVITSSVPKEGEDDDDQVVAASFKIKGSWFVDKIKKIMESEKSKYLQHWEALNRHLTAVELDYNKNDSTVLSQESSRIMKQRFSGFNEDFERTYELHKKLCLIDTFLKTEFREAVAEVFLPRYRRFHDKYTKVKFSRKHQREYTKYAPDMLDVMLEELYVDPEVI